MSVTIKDISKHVGVSYSTVAKALNNSPLVKEATKRKVIAVAESLGYRPNLAARSLVTKRTGLIGIVWPNVERPALSSLLTSIQKRLADKGLTALLSIDEAQQAITTFLNLRVDAILMFEESADGIDDGQALANVPFISIGMPVRPDVPAVDMNRREAIKLAVTTLIAKGHTRIAYIGPYAEASIQQREKWIGYREGIYEGGLSFENGLLIDSNGLSWQHGYQAAQQLLALSNRPTAVISGSYDLAAGMLRAFQTYGITVPDDIAIISYDHIPHLEQLEVSISAVGVSEDALSEAVTRTVLQSIESPGSVPLRTPLTPEYIHRRSD
ncbi:LacI family DNA-binding transcriptional regulator [Paenibacillus xylaniclasticus]|uniref:LacI family DNA-binding transcriptional regulator n=1 Tax=Paenibacillus xylaniclasticus TaxID=588083 RepID=UPI000FD74796|nr:MULTISPECIES: LacI family DNA-binding transcriptional regulator [Paenibacillus]GFN33537.1 LacI family transcriptional regulator [Paenibacillus curdlanolyticus]